MSSSSEWVIKVVLIGEPRVGKTSIRRSYLGDKFENNYLQTLGADFSHQRIRIDEHSIEINIWDLAGQQKYHIVHPMYFKGSDGAIITYDVTDESSFYAVKQWLNRYYEYTKNDFKGPVLIVGNKIDLAEYNTTINEKLENDLIKDLKNKFGEKYILFKKTSAKTGSNINAAFTDLVKQIIKSKIKFVNEYYKIKENYRDKILGEYLITFDEELGPAIITKLNDNLEITTKENLSAIKIASIIDSEDLIYQDMMMASFPWSMPRGTFHYIAFLYETENHINENFLIIIGFVSDNSIRNLLLKSSERIDGILQATRNKITNSLIQNGVTSKNISNNILIKSKNNLDFLLTNMKEDIVNYLNHEIK